MRNWTNEEIDLLNLWIKEGLTYEVIANELDRTEKSIRNKVCRLKIKSNWKGNSRHKKSTKDYIIELKKKCPTIICLEEYIGTHIPILHKCLVCNKISKSRPSDKLNGKACKYCNNGVPKKSQNILYLVYFYNIDLYKIGITSRTVIKRLHGIGYPYEIIIQRKTKNALILEQEWLSNINEYKVNTGLLKSGNTETFRF